MRRVLPAITLLLAGCVAEPTTPAAIDDVLPLPAPLARVVSVIDPAGGRGEPSLGVAPDGTLYSNGPGRNAATVNSGSVYRSTDGGATWEKLATPTLTPDFDPDLAVDVDGTIWFDALWVGCSSTAVSRDAGKTWTTNPLACVPPGGDRQYVIPTKGGEAYIYAHHVPTLHQMVAKTTDYGRTWIPLGSAEPPTHSIALGKSSGWGGGGFWNPVANSIYITYTLNDAGKWFPAASVSRDGGKTWQVVTVPNAGGGRLGLSLVVGAADEAGNVYLAWGELHEKTVHVYFASSTDDGKTWSAPKLVDDSVGSKVFPAITAGAPGAVSVAYYSTDAEGAPAAVAKDAKWNVTLAWTTDALAETPAFERGQLSNGTARTGPVCPNGTTCQGNRQLLDYFSLKTMPDGRVASVWTSTDDVEGKTVNVFAATDRVLLR